MERYETISKIATGSYGVVYLCKDKHAGGALVAVKVFLQANCHPQVLKSAMRESALLQQCKGHPNIVQVQQAYRSESGRVYLVLEHIPHVLSKLIHQHVGPGFQPEQIKSILYQLLQAIRFIHRNKIIHRDLKPANIMLNKDGVVKLIDFGLARQGRPQDGHLTPYVLTRWYRAPEVLVGAPYSYEVDIWALGCIAAEMTNGQPLFPGQSHMDQLQLVLRCFGRLPNRFMQACGDAASRGDLQLPDVPDPIGLRRRLFHVPNDLFGVIAACLQPDPLRRSTAEELLHMPYFKGCSVPRTEGKLAGCVTAAPAGLRRVTAGAAVPATSNKTCNSNNGTKQTGSGGLGSNSNIPPLSGAPSSRTPELHGEEAHRCGSETRCSPDALTPDTAAASMVRQNAPSRGAREQQHGAAPQSCRHAEAARSKSNSSSSSSSSRSVCSYSAESGTLHGKDSCSGVAVHVAGTPGKGLGSWLGSQPPQLPAAQCNQGSGCSPGGHANLHVGPPALQGCSGSYCPFSAECAACHEERGADSSLLAGVDAHEAPPAPMLPPSASAQQLGNNAGDLAPGTPVVLPHVQAPFNASSCAIMQGDEEHGHLQESIKQDWGRFRLLRDPQPPARSISRSLELHLDRDKLQEQLAKQQQQRQEEQRGQAMKAALKLQALSAEGQLLAPGLTAVGAESMQP